MYSRQGHTHATSRERSRSTMLISSSSTLNRVFRWPKVYRNATYGRLIVLVTRLFVRNDYFRQMHILESKATLLELLVSTDQRMRESSL